jgi:hypothetical protein
VGFERFRFGAFGWKILCQQLSIHFPLGSPFSSGRPPLFAFFSFFIFLALFLAVLNVPLLDCTCFICLF